ncbi:MAG: pyruvate kinase [Candidatus Methylomirabilales bacterium]
MRGRRVKIVCTLGPACRGRKDLIAMARAGMDVARLNFSHGDHAEHARMIRLLRDVSREIGRPLGILADLAGPKIRTGKIPGGVRRLRRGEDVVLSPHLNPRGDGVIGTTYPRLAEDLAPGHTVLLDDGRLELRVVRIRGSDVHCRVREGGELRSHKGINLPGVLLSTPALTAKDRHDLAFALEQGVDLVALSFVLRADELRRARRLVHRLAGKMKKPRDADGSPFAGPHPPLIAKLEKPQALEHLEGILLEAGGVMVARGDLGVEISPERVPAAQKLIIRRANALGRPVITATQMLESMTERNRPSRAEASDVANAVLDGTDAVMLSAETATGCYPVEAVRMMDRIIRETESSVPRRAGPEQRMTDLGESPSPEDAVSRAATTLGAALGAAAIVAFTASGSTALRLARRRPSLPLLAFSPDDDVIRRLTLVWGVTPRILTGSRRLSPLVHRADRALQSLRLARRGDRVVLVMGYPPGRMGLTNLVKIHIVGEST